MYLKSLTMKGFKSFAKPTTLVFEPGVTCVVGPNGSGKSNVVDALAWVMGEQGAKSLRGGTMEDVIFAGTATRGPLGRAEVSLTIDNSDGALPIDYTEVTVRRTLFRQGGSEYAINGQSCRLLDVQELLSDSGLGREMHVIVGQGQLDAVLHATALDRRGFIEEAAGILKHRRRKEKTLRKLDAMEANLTRLKDLVAEVRRQLKPLGAQAKAAKQAQSVAATVRDARSRLLADEVVRLRAELDAHARSESERSTERMVLTEQREQVRLRVERIEQTQTHDGVDDAREVAHSLESLQSRLRSLYTLAHQRVALLGQQEEPSDSLPTVSQAQIDQAQAEIAQLGQQVESAEQLWNDAAEQVRLARAELDAVDAEIAAQSALVSEHDLEISKREGQVDAAASRLAAVRAESERRRSALTQAAQRLKDADAALREAEAAPQTPGEDVTALTSAYEQAEADADEAERQLEAARTVLREAERERDGLQARAAALELALDRKDGTSALAESGVPGLRGLLAENMTVKPGCEAAIAAALGSLAEAVLADDHEAAADALRHAQDHDLGRVEVVVGSAADAELVAPGGATPAEQVVTASEGVLALLANTLIVDSLSEARRILAAHESPRGLQVVTLAGEVVSPHVVRGGSGGQSSRVELVAERDRARERAEAMVESAAQAESDHVARREKLAAARQALTEARQALRSAEQRESAQQERLNRLRATAQAAAEEHERASTAHDGSRAQEGEALGAHREAERRLEQIRSTPRPMLDAGARDDAGQLLEAAREREVAARLEAETAKERVNGWQRRLESLVDQREAQRRAAQAAARRAAQRRRQAEIARGVVADLPVVLDSADRSTSQARTELAEAQRRRERSSSELTELRARDADLARRLAEVTESVHGLELRSYETKLTVSNLVEQAASDLGLSEDVLVAEYGPDVPIPDEPTGAATRADPSTDRAPADAADETGDSTADAAPTHPFDRAEQEQRLADAERRLTRIGRVNPLALEEYAALEQRHTFLTEQLTDLEKTRGDLLSIIDDIDETMQSVFEQAFDDTREAFAEVFDTLFPGGSGTISLTEPNDLLATGIDVSVKPAGKKIERLTLLSGGERSLAAVAFLIAIFKARPSPFYIMDEVEAALDDANLGRLLAIFESLRASSQLVIITHQKRTMEVADALYGVSMRRDGVSAVVGQRVREPDSA